MIQAYIRNRKVPLSKQIEPKRLLIFELSCGGHYPEYIAHLIDYWRREEADLQLDILVSPQFIQQHDDVVELVERCNSKRITITAISETEYTALKPFNSALNRNIRAWQEFKLIRKYALKLNSDRIFLPYFDNRQLPIVWGQRLPCSYSGIYFRPSFHYGSLGNYRLSWRDKLQHWREKTTLSIVLKDSKLKTLYCLDPFAIEQIDRLTKQAKAVYLPDPVKTPQTPSNIERLVSELGVEQSRQIHLLFGGIGKRKGLDKLLESITLLPKQLCQKLCLLVVGQMADNYYRDTLDTVKQITNALPVQIVIKNQRVPQVEVQQYFDLADVILAPYQRHVGMSGILVRAAVATKPALSSDYGLMGEVTRRYRLGLAVDSTKAEELAAGLTEFLNETPAVWGDRQKMQLFARQNDPNQFAKTVFQHLLT